MEAILFCDFETRSVINLKLQGADNYARDPSTIVMAFGYCFDGGEIKVNEIFQPPPLEVIEHVESGKKVVAHNAHFEWLIWNFVWRRDYPSLPELKITQMDCTMARCYAMSIPAKLEKAAPALGIQDEKDMKGQRVALQLSRPKPSWGYKTSKPQEVPEWFSPVEHSEKFQKMYEYCKKDVALTRELFSRTVSLSKSEREIWELDHLINQRGMAVDLNAAKKAVEIVDFETIRLNEKIRQITSNSVATTNARTQLTDWIRGFGVDTETLKKPDVIELLERTDLPEDVRKALEIRQESAKSSTAKYLSLVNRTSPFDERLRSTIQYHGANTGRFSGRGFQLHNLPRSKLEQMDIEAVIKVLGG